MHPDDRGGVRRVTARPQPRVAAQRGWRPWQKHLLGVGIAWLTLTITGWILFAYFRLLEPWRDQVVTCCWVRWCWPLGDGGGGQD
ncbi:hypothetical protein Areg01_81780 [Actinoplanes regularis]|nr:hypothetical protein Areg01_81780 [Actinoplanes regularis]